MGNMERTGIKAEESNPAGFHGYLQAISRWRDGERERKGRATKKDKETLEVWIFILNVSKKADGSYERTKH